MLVNLNEVLLDAQKNPEKFKTLSVRVSGWNARFVTLNKEWQPDDPPHKIHNKIKSSRRSGGL